MLKYLSPTLLSLVIGAAGMSPAWSATVEERDQHAIAAARLMMSKLRLPGERQLKEYQEAGYPTSDPHLDRVLRFTYLDQFLSDLPEKDKGKNEAELKALRAELEASLKGGKLSPVAKQIFSGGGGSASRMVNEIARIMHPEAPPPLVEMAVEKKQILSRLLDALGKQAEEDFKAAVDKVKANKAAEDKLWDLTEGSPEYRTAVDQAVDLRLEAMRPLFVAMIALRDAAHRGKEFGIDPEPVKAQLKKMFASERPELDKKTWAEVFSNWDFEWGEFQPYIRLNAGALLSDAMVNGAKSAKEEEVEGTLQAVADFNAKEFKDTNIRAEAYRFKLQAWAHLLRYRLELNTPRSLNRGTAAWQDFQERAKQDDFLRLDRAPSKIVGELGKLYLIAARLYKAKGDLNNANGLMAELVGAKPANPYAHYAKSWLAYWGANVGQGSGTNAWAQRPLADDPGKSILIAKAFMSEANATADAAQARSNYLSAAVSLRNGVLGLTSGVVEEKDYIEFAPQTYQLYSYVLYKLELRHQAVVAAQEGARALAAKMKWYADNKKPNPWQKTNAEGKQVWDESRVTPLKVANDGLIFASNLKLRDPNTVSLYNDSIELLTTIDPAARGENLSRQQLVGMLQEGDYENLLREADSFTGKYPESYLWAFTLKSSAITQWMDKLGKDGDKAKIAQLSQLLAKDNEGIAKRISEELKNTGLAPDRRKELERARSTIKVSEVENLIASGKYEDVIKRLDADFWKNPPSDETLAARTLRQLCRATFEWHKSREEMLSKDPAAMLAAMKTYDLVYQNVHRGVGKLRNKGVDVTIDNASKQLAIVFQRSVLQIQRLQQAGNATAELVATAEVANRAFADLYEPTIDDRTPPANVLFIARILWDVDERQRAAKQFARYIDLVSKDSDLSAFRADAKPILDKHSTVITARGEFKKAWEEIVDLAWDSQEDSDAYLKLPQPNWPARQRRNYGKALEKIAEFRSKTMAANKAVVAPAQYKQIEESVDSVQKMIAAVASLTTAKSRLATFFRANDQFDKALPLLMELYNDDPLNLDNQMALVLVTYNAALKGDPMPPKAELEKARSVAANIRAEKNSTPDKLGYWEAYTLVLEFSVIMGDTKVVNDSLSFLRRNRSDMSRDLIAPPVWGDDKRARRPLNALSVQLAKRFLGLHERPGITEKAAFKIVEVSVGGATQTVFTDPDAPAFEAKVLITPDEDEVTALVASDGSTPAPAKPTPPEPDAAAPATPAAPDAKADK
jgi:hypothetical protein